MRSNSEELQDRAQSVFQKYQDAELRDYMLGLTQSLEAAEVMYHHFGYLLRHVRATVAHQSRSLHLQQAIESAQRCLKRYGERDASTPNVGGA